ncbi:glycosyltransferase family 39 protein [Paenibacillus tianjinensis]|uniref:Glycosyltransferase family 39 protein n=1 Tax=Paenibacillus tianjinensis TaxID=2810347 RepID=A0ABX7LDS4_9BACL|nr:glycosyltransferase family 39 protein [Paenibacillus tianjinensis]QSF45551.1 glycosyltransferase family 39 protein [Paenibacillus tianjinensis]
MLLFVLGAVIRLVYIGSVPPGLNQDEASIGYDAYAILHYGIDRSGVRLPIHLTAWGSGQNALYAYLSMPFLLLFGLTPLSVRALSAVMGLVGMLFFYLIMKQLFTTRTAGIAAMFFIVINPWHIMMSRWALESNLFPTLILIAVYCILQSFHSPKWIYAFTAVLALSLYAYGTAYFFVPVFALGTAILLLYSKVLNVRTLLWNGLLFVLLALPILLFIVINHYDLQAITTPLLSVPKLTMPRVEQISSVFSGQLLQTAIDNFREFIQIMLSGSDGLPWNSISWYGYAYPVALPFALIGLIVMIQALRRQGRKEAGRAVILLWLLTAVLMAFITTVNINRINIIFYPLIMLVTAGFIWLYQKLKIAGILSAAAFTVMFASFAGVYFREFPDRIGPAFFDSLGEAVQYASEHSTGEIYVTDEVNMPYIYVLFYEQINPHDFRESVVYSNPGDAFQQVSSFGRYRFGRPDELAGNSAYIFSNSNPIPGAAEGGYTVKQFANYSVLLTTEHPDGDVPLGPSADKGFYNGGFEDGAAGWSFSEGTGVASNNPGSGTYLAYLDAGADKTVSQAFTAQAPPGEYKLSVLVSAGGEGGKIGLRVNGILQAEAVLTAGEEYHQITLPAVALQQGDQAKVIITGGNGWINIDEVRLER